MSEGGNQPAESTNTYDLSHVYANDHHKGQDAFDELPHDLHLHLARAIAHHAGLAPHPGVYRGRIQGTPALEAWDPNTESGTFAPSELAGSPQQQGQSSFELAQQEEKNVLNNMSQGSPPEIPPPTSAPKPKKLKLGSKPDFTDLGS